MASRNKNKELLLEEALVPVEEQPNGVPHNWIWIRLKNTVDVRTGKKDANYGTEDGIYPFFTCASEPIKSPDYSFDDEVVLLPGNGANVGLALYYKGKFEAYQRTYILSNFVGSIKYLYFNLLYNWKAYNENKQYGSATNYIKLGNITNYILPLPPIREQQRIVDIIETLFLKIDKAQELINEASEEFEDRKAAILAKAFRGELTKKWRKEHPKVEFAGSYLEQIRQNRKLAYESDIEKAKVDSNVRPIRNFDFEYKKDNSLPESWVIAKLDKLIYMAGRIGWKGLKADEYTSEGPLFLSVYNLNYGDIVDFRDANHISRERYDESPEIKLRANDILLTKDGAGIGKIGFIETLDYDATVNSSLLVIRALDAVYSKYLFYFLKGPEMQKIVKSRITGSTTPHLFQRDIKEFELAIPPMEEQMEIVRILDKLVEEESKIQELVQLDEQLELLRKSILAKAFRGELGTNDPTEESALSILEQVLREKYNIMK
ncbi:MAG: restriction modification system specificity domain protein [Clostridia bacterium]|jgi:type I restriction enzyme S subunit|nr:restriction modification system specificity domain protein [Clostridia bacterium]